MKAYGFVDQLVKSFDQVPDDVKQKINSAGGLHEKDILYYLTHPKDSSVTSAPPNSAIVKFYHDRLDDLACLGLDAISKNEIAYCIFADSPRALSLLPEINITLFDLKVQQSLGNCPIWVVVNPLHRHLFEEKVARLPKEVGDRITLLDHFLTYKFTPDNLLQSGNYLSCCGSGDIFPIITTNKDLIKNIKHVVVVDIDNIFATMDPALIGHHIESRVKVTCEVTKRKDHELEDILVDAFDGPQIIRLAQLNDDDKNYTWTATGSYIIDVSSQFESLGKNWQRVVLEEDKKLSVQYKRYIHEITTAYISDYVGVLRSERYMPVRCQEDVSNIKNIITN